MIVIGHETIIDGPYFLKSLIDVAYTNTRSSSAIIRGILASLDDYLKPLKDSNIETFNQYVKHNLKNMAVVG